MYELDGPYIEFRMKEPMYPSMPESVVELANVYGLNSEYDVKRDEVAEKLAWEPAKIDRMVDQLCSAVDRPPVDSPEKTDATLAALLKNVEPWPEHVETTDLLDQIVVEMNKYLILPDGGALLAPWILHTYIYQANDVSPYLMLKSPVWRCGKTTVLKFLKKTCCRALPAPNISASSLFRTITKWHPTLLCDEADTHVKTNDELNNLLNAGHEREMAFVIRSERVGDNFEPTLFQVYGPKAIACIGKLARTLADRSIVLAMQRKAPQQKIKRMGKFDGTEIKRKAVRWARDNFDRLKGVEPDMPEILNDRAQDNWLPLFAICDLAKGSEWPGKIRKAAGVLSDVPEQHEIGMQLLDALRSIFSELHIDRISSADLCRELGKLPDAPWADWMEKGRPPKLIGAKRVAAYLLEFQVKPKTIRLPGQGTIKGYLLPECEGAFNRYIPIQAPPDSEGVSQEGVFAVTPSQVSKGAADSGDLPVTLPVTVTAPKVTCPTRPENVTDLPVTVTDDVTDQNAPKALRGNECYGVTGKSAPRDTPPKAVAGFVAPFGDTRDQELMKVCRAAVKGEQLTAGEMYAEAVRVPEDLPALLSDPKCARTFAKGLAKRLMVDEKHGERF